MPSLVVVADPLSGERRTFAVREGETLGAALVRLWPHGIDGGWRIYRDEVHPDNELAATELPYTVALAGETYLLVRQMAGPVVPFIANLVISFLLTKFIEVLSPIRRPHVYGEGISDIISPNNKMAGQSNQLRPGARVPDILGRVRAYPDLLILPVDTYTEAQQNIQQVFVLGIGDYDVDDARLGDTPVESMQDARLRVLPPGANPPAMYVMRASPEVQGISLISDITAEVEPSPGSDFIAATKQISTLDRLTTDVERPLLVSTSLFNNGVFWVTAVPPDSQVVGPYVYTVDGPVIDETDSNASFAYPPEIYSGSKVAYFGKANPYDIGPPNDRVVEIRQVTSQVFDVGDLVSFHLPSGAIYHGRVTQATGPVPLYSALLVRHLDAYGIPQHFPTLSNITTAIRAYRTSGLPTRAVDPLDGELITNAPTPWYASPMPEADELWVDVEFPQGLAKYLNGSRRLMTIDIVVDFRRAPATDPQVSKALKFVYGTATPLRFTRTFKVSDLVADGLPDSTGSIEVRLTRTTKFQADDDTQQFVQDTRWARLAAVRVMDSERYDKATVLFLDLSNSRSATSLGETSLNVIATRRLPTWSAGAWSAPAGTRRWADNFVARCLAPDGAHRSEAQVDIAGIYKLQQDLDDLDPKLGQISMTLDTMQDIDTELAQIADVVRAVVYRVGRKLFVTRDQANSTPIALFNARTKSPAGESVAVRMTADADNDCVVIPWIDEAHGWKRREYQYPEPADVIAVNPLRASLIAANWEQAYRRALFEWNRLKYRREQMSCDVTEDGRMCRPGDVVNMTDDIANLSTFAGEVLVVEGATLTLDRDVEFIAGSHTILLRDVQGIALDRIPVIAGAAPNMVVLERSPAIEIRGRDAARGTLFAFYPDATANVRQWLITGLVASGPYVTLTGVNYSPKVYLGDSAPLPTPPVEVPEVKSPITLDDLTVTSHNTAGVGVAQYELTSGGDVRATAGAIAVLDAGDWIEPKSNFSLYSARATLVSGTSTTGTFGAWLNLATTRTWTLQGGVGGVDAVWLIEIRLDSTGALQDSATVTVHAESEAAASPISIANVTVNAFNTGSVGKAQYQLTSAGGVRFTSGTNAVVYHGDWISPLSGMSLYSARATILSGSSTTGVFGTWLNLATTRTWTLSGGGGGVDATWLIEIRLDSTGIVQDTATLTVHAERDA